MRRRAGFAGRRILPIEDRSGNRSCVVQTPSLQVLLVTSDAALRAAAAESAPTTDSLIPVRGDDPAVATVGGHYAQVWIDLDTAPREIAATGVRRVYFHSSGTVELRGVAPGLFVRKPCTAAVWRMLWSGSASRGAVRYAAASAGTEGGVPDWLLTFQELELSALCHKCVTRLPAQLGFEHASLYLHDPHRRLLTLAETNDTRPVELAVPLDGAGTLMTAVARAGEPLVTLDVEQVRQRRGIERRDAPTRPYRDKSCLIAPLLADGQLRGVLNLSGRSAPAEDIDLRGLERVLAFVARALWHAQVYEQARTDARVDGLTGLYNYRWLHETLAREIGRAERFGEPLSLLVADLDGLKDINDRHGHVAGDAALREAAQRMQAAARGSDSLARVGGDEFVMILPHADEQGAAGVAARVCELIRREPVPYRGESIRLSISVGVATWRTGEDSSALLERADRQMYEAKRAAAADGGAAPVAGRRSRFEPSEPIINLDALRRRKR